MPAITDIIINKSVEAVWAIIADASTHPHWLSADCVTTYEGELAEGTKFTRFNTRLRESVQGEIVALRPSTFLKVRMDAPGDAFFITEYHLLSTSEGCALRVIFELFDTGKKRHGYYPEVIEEQWRGNLVRLKGLCEAA